MISIFGKLYTLLRRPQAANQDEMSTPDYGEAGASASADSSSNNPEVKVTSASSTTEVKVKVDEVGSGDTAMPTAPQLMTSSTASCEWEHIQTAATTDKGRVSEKPAVPTNANDAGSVGDERHMIDSVVSQGWEYIPSAENGNTNNSSISENTNSSANRSTVLSNSEAQKQSQTDLGTAESNQITVSNIPAEGVDVTQASVATTDAASVVKSHTVENDKTSAESSGNCDLPTRPSNTHTDKPVAMETEKNTVTPIPPAADNVKPDTEGEQADDKHAVSHDDKPHDRKHGKSRKKKVCSYYKKGTDKCWKGGKCAFVHERYDYKQEKMEDAAVNVGAEVERKTILEADFPSYLEYVHAMTEEGRQIVPKDLFYKLGYMKGVDQKDVGVAVTGQYKMAKTKQMMIWVKEARYFAALFFGPDWINENLPMGDPKYKNKNKRPKQHRNVNEHFENPGGLCKDFRLKDNPSIQKVVANAGGDVNIVTADQKQTDTNNSAKVEVTLPENTSDGDKLVTAAKKETYGHGDGSKTAKSTPAADVNNSAVMLSAVNEFVNDYTEQVIQKAMQMAISDGLSESLIMEVIDDVTSASVATPRKKVKPVPVDLSRTPRSRPEQLAIGFNYHSDVVIKESPKTVHGQIIPIELLPTPKERTEQLAVGFGYHADQLVKDSPRTQSGEVLIPGIVTTPSRRTRDQLAVGFNYHAETLSQDTSFCSEAQNQYSKAEEKANEKAKSSSTISDSVTVTDKSNVQDASSAMETETACLPKSIPHSSKKLSSDTIAVGFSYCSDNALKGPLQEINANIAGDSYCSDDAMKAPLKEINANIVTSDECVSELIKDATLGEGRNVVEGMNEESEGRLAGSVW